MGRNDVIVPEISSDLSDMIVLAQTNLWWRTKRFALDIPLVL